MASFQMTDVDTKQIDSAAASIANDIAELNKIMNQFTQNTMSGISPYWQGAAKTSFEQQFAAYLQGLQNLIGQYSSLNDKLREAGGGYDKADDAAKSVIARLPK